MGNSEFGRRHFGARVRIIHYGRQRAEPEM